jgi:hypothetical protein
MSRRSRRVHAPIQIDCMLCLLIRIPLFSPTLLTIPLSVFLLLLLLFLFFHVLKIQLRTVRRPRR